MEINNDNDAPILEEPVEEHPRVEEDINANILHTARFIFMLTSEEIAELRANDTKRTFKKLKKFCCQNGLYVLLQLFLLGLVVY